MIDFQLSPLESDLRSEFNLFAREILRPLAAEADRIADVPQAALKKQEVLTNMKAFIPERLGGGFQSLSFKDRVYDLSEAARLRVLYCEEIGYGDAALGVALPGPGLAEPILRSFGSIEQQSRLFDIFLGSTPHWAAFALTEPSVGSDATAITTSARKDRGQFVINGRKWFIGNGARADWVIVFASTHPHGGGFGMRAFVVERGTPGFRVGRILDSLGLKALQISELIFEDCRVSCENLLGPEKTDFRRGGFQGAVQTFNLVRPGVAAMGVGIGRAVIEHIEEIVLQNGARHFLAHRWLALKDRIERMKGRLEATRLLCWKAACLYDHGEDNSMEASMAKALSAKVGMEICTEAMSIAGTACLNDISPLEKWFRDMKAFDFLEGTGEIQRLMVARLLMRNKNRLAS